jgi:hypothetical protein
VFSVGEGEPKFLKVRKKRLKTALGVPHNSQSSRRYHSISLAGCTLRSDSHPDYLADHLRARRFGALDQGPDKPPSALALSPSW